MLIKLVNIINSLCLLCPALSMIMVKCSGQTDFHHQHQSHQLSSQSDHTISKRASDSNWTYEGQKEWIGLTDSRCGSDRQSPINLIPSKAKVDKSLYIDTRTYDKLIDPESATVKLTGHNLKLEIKSKGTYSLSGSAVDGCSQELLQVHIHWGSNSMEGSEHAIDGERFAAEIHFVHKNSKYENMENYTDMPDALTVLGVIAKNGDPNPGLDILLEALENNKSVGTYRLKKTFNLNHFLPKNMKSFFRYSGSLTTPNCNEMVTWIVMKDFIEVSNEQIQKLRKTLDPAGHEAETVVRDLQPLQGRVVFQSDSGSAISPALTSLCYLILYLIIHITLIGKSQFD